MNDSTSNDEVLQDLTILNEQVIFHEKRAEAAREEWRKKIHTTTAEKLRDVSKHIIALQSALSEALNRTAPIKRCISPSLVGQTDTSRCGTTTFYYLLQGTLYHEKDSTATQ